MGHLFTTLTWTAAVRLADLGAYRAQGIFRTLTCAATAVKGH
jgi:hypothetical protein